MKKIISVMMFSLIGFTYMNAQEISFTNEEVNYGDVNKGTDGNKSFTFKNTGDQPLIIKMVKPSCGCTVADYPKQPIAPGQTGTIKVGYDTKIVGAFNKTIEVHSNAKESSRKILRIKGKVVEQL